MAGLGLAWLGEARPGGAGQGKARPGVAGRGREIKNSEEKNQMKQIAMSIKGLSPLLMHRYPEEPIEALEKKSKDEQARLALYEHAGTPHIPGRCLQRALVGAASFSKGKGRASLQKVSAAGLFVDEVVLPLNGTKWVVDSQSVVIPATRGRVMRHRPRFDSWQVACTLTYDNDLMTEAQVRRIVDDAGARVGLLDFRPEKKGPFGRFMVVEWKSL
jgi:hypothetical protein